MLSIVERIGEAPAAALFGLITGIIFGVAAQRSAFCLRAATVEFARGHAGPRLAVWLLTFSTALVWVQSAELAGLMRAPDARMMAVTGSWSGAVIGGLLFGVGMVLARGCSGRLLVLAATGNLRAVVSGLIFAVVAQMSLAGAAAQSACSTLDHTRWQERRPDRRRRPAPDGWTGAWLVDRSRGANSRFS